MLMDRLSRPERWTRCSWVQVEEAITISLYKIRAADSWAQNKVKDIKWVVSVVKERWTLIDQEMMNKKMAFKSLEHGHRLKKIMMQQHNNSIQKEEKIHLRDHQDSLKRVWSIMKWR